MLFGHARHALAVLQPFGVFKAEVEFFLERVRILIAADGDVAREQWDVPPDDIDVHHARADVQQRDGLAGGTARVPGLIDLLREEFAVPVEEIYPFRKIVINPARHNEDQIREFAPRLTIAVGLALRSFDTP